jgi:hypothetical protein
MAWAKSRSTIIDFFIIFCFFNFMYSPPSFAPLRLSLPPKRDRLSLLKQRGGMY